MFFCCRLVYSAGRGTNGTCTNIRHAGFGRHACVCLKLSSNVDGPTSSFKEHASDAALLQTISGTVGRPSNLFERWPSRRRRRRHRHGRRRRLRRGVEKRLGGYDSMSPGANMELHVLRAPKGRSSSKTLLAAFMIVGGRVNRPKGQLDGDPFSLCVCVCVCARVFLSFPFWPGLGFHWKQ